MTNALTHMGMIICIGRRARKLRIFWSLSPSTPLRNHGAEGPRKSLHFVGPSDFLVAEPFDLVDPSAPLRVRTRHNLYHIDIQFYIQF